MSTQTTTPAPPTTVETPPMTAPRLQECPECGQMQVVPTMPPATRAICLRCDTVLRHTRHDPLLLPLALNLCALILFVRRRHADPDVGDHRVDSNGSPSWSRGPAELEQYGLWEMSLVVLVTTVAAPLARVLCMLVVLIGLRVKRPPAELRTIFAWVEHLRPGR